MAAKEIITKVWIEEGCIVCDACETASPEVFHVTDDTCVIRPEALTPDFTKPLTDSIVEAAEECPVDVIKFETEVGEAPEGPAEAPAAPATVSAEASVAAAPKAPAQPAAAAAAKAPAQPSAKPVAEPATAVAAKAPAAVPKVSVAGDPDPAIQALLRAATWRGGLAAISKSDDGATPAVKAWEKKPASELPPDARQAKVMAATKKASENSGVTRRGVLSGSACGIGWLAFGGTSAVSGLAFTRFMMPNVLEEPDPKVQAGTLEVYATMVPGEVNEDFKSEGFWIVRSEGKVAALNIICTHLGCIPNWLPNDRKFKCPCHGSGFYANGVNFEGPAPRPLERFRIALVDGTVLVDRSKKFQYEKGEWDNPESFIEV
ncbi:MAG: Rieske 2Fe-2S domain-containing protein [Phycisphaerae bacterium]